MLLETGGHLAEEKKKTCPLGRKGKGCGPIKVRHQGKKKEKSLGMTGPGRSGSKRGRIVNKGGKKEVRKR